MSTVHDIGLALMQIVEGVCPRDIDLFKGEHDSYTLVRISGSEHETSNASEFQVLLDGRTYLITVIDEEF